MRIGILALQGAFAEHGHMLDQLGAGHFEIRQKKDLEIQGVDPYGGMDGLIIPGGESTVIGKLLRELGMLGLLRDKIQSGMPVFGTCAGLILLAKEVVGNPAYLGTMDIQVKRNAYGRQLGSFHTEQEFKGIGVVPMSFIRAPYIEEVCGNTEILAWANGKIVAACQGNQLVTAFHPEVTGDLRIHQYFLDIVSNCISEG